ncbi:unnamed protein product [Orchesella dallaii]|uniref:Diacylglycerol O-acyltransferase n=1 Tax=Orchesella dallaii TaxID=48710 RepID=A0ABP1QDS3_9HEXA
MVAPIYIFRLVVILLAKLFRPDLGEIVNALSSIFVHDLFSGKRPRCNLIVPMTLQGHWTPEEFKEIIHEKWIKDRFYQKFCQYPYPWLGFMFWKNDSENFNLNNHIAYHKSSSGTTTSTEKLNELVENLLNEPFSPERSPWELHYVANYKNTQDKVNTSDEPTFALVLKIHHCLADGFSLLSAIAEGLGGQSLNKIKMPSPQNTKGTFLEELTFFLTFPFKVLSEFVSAYENGHEKCSWRVSDKRKAWWQLYARSELIPIRQIKDIKNAFGVSFTSVLLSAIASGIHEDLKLRRKSSITLPQNRSMPCLSVLPVPGHSRRLTNRATATVIPLPTASYPDSASRLKECDLVLRNGRKSVIPYVIRFGQAALGCHLNSVCKGFTKNTMVSAGLTNFPGIPIEIDIANAKGISVDFAAGAVEGDAGAAFMALSYGNYIRLALTAEKAVMNREQVNRLISNIQKEINVLYDEAMTLSDNKKFC